MLRAFMCPRVGFSSLLFEFDPSPATENFLLDIGHMHFLKNSHCTPMISTTINTRCLSNVVAKHVLPLTTITTK